MPRSPTIHLWQRCYRHLAKEMWDKAFTFEQSKKVYDQLWIQQTTSFEVALHCFSLFLKKHAFELHFISFCNKANYVSLSQSDNRLAQTRLTAQIFWRQSLFYEWNQLFYGINLQFSVNTYLLLSLSLWRLDGYDGVTYLSPRGCDECEWFTFSASEEGKFCSDSSSVMHEPGATWIHVNGGIIMTNLVSLHGKFGESSLKIRYRCSRCGYFRKWQKYIFCTFRHFVNPCLNHD